jgi:hypothetical protein
MSFVWAYFISRWTKYVLARQLAMLFSRIFYSNLASLAVTLSKSTLRWSVEEIKPGARLTKPLLVARIDGEGIYQRNDAAFIVLGEFLQYRDQPHV